MLSLIDQCQWDLNFEIKFDENPDASQYNPSTISAGIMYVLDKRYDNYSSRNLTTMYGT